METRRGTTLLLSLQPAQHNELMCGARVAGGFAWSVGAWRPLIVGIVRVRFAEPS